MIPAIRAGSPWSEAAALGRIHGWSRRSRTGPSGGQRCAATDRAPEKRENPRIRSFAGRFRFGFDSPEYIRIVSYCKYNMCLWLEGASGSAVRAAMRGVGALLTEERHPVADALTGLGAARDRRQRARAAPRNWRTPWQGRGLRAPGAVLQSVPRGARRMDRHTKAAYVSAAPLRHALTKRSGIPERPPVREVSRTGATVVCRVPKSFGRTHV